MKQYFRNSLRGLVAVVLLFASSKLLASSQGENAKRVQVLKKIALRQANKENFDDVISLFERLNNWLNTMTAGSYTRPELNHLYEQFMGCSVNLTNFIKRLEHNMALKDPDLRKVENIHVLMYNIMKEHNDLHYIIEKLKKHKIISDVHNRHILSAFSDYQKALIKDLLDVIEHTEDHIVSEYEAYYDTKADSVFDRNFFLWLTEFRTTYKTIEKYAPEEKHRIDSVIKRQKKFFIRIIDKIIASIKHRIKVLQEAKIPQDISSYTGEISRLRKFRAFISSF